MPVLCLRRALVLLLLTAFWIVPGVAEVASSWSPTLLVNTESFQTIDEGSSTTDIELRFGSTLNERIYWDRAAAEFRFTDDIRVDGNITASGNLVINAASRFKNNLDVVGTVSGGLLRLGNFTVSGAIAYSSGNTLRQTAKGLSGQLLIGQATAAPVWRSPTGGMVWFLDGTQRTGSSLGAKVTMPFSLTATDITMNIIGTPVGAALIVDINRDGTSIFSTRPQINSGAIVGGSSAVLSQTSLPINSVITIDVDQVGSTFAGSGLTVTLRGTRRY